MMVRARTRFFLQSSYSAVDCMPLEVVCIQRFVVLWEGQPDTRVIDLIEQSITLAVLSPVKLLHASKGMLVVVYDSVLVGETYKLFHLAWAKIAAGAWYENWTVLLIKDTDAGRGVDGGRIFRHLARDILDDSEVGIAEFTRDMFLFKDDWSPENIFGPPPAEEADAASEQQRDEPDLLMMTWIRGASRPRRATEPRDKAKDR